MSNLPCKGCFWIEGGRCYQDKLADVHDLERAPRNAPLFSGLNGLEITDPLITACVERGLTKSKAAVYGRLIAHLQASGIEVVQVGGGTAASA